MSGEVEALRRGIKDGPLNVGWDSHIKAALELIDTQNAEINRLRGWPDIEIPTAGSPVDFYRCENEDCPSEYEFWQFRPDDYELDETAVLCPACGGEGEMYFRRFRSGYTRTTEAHS